MSLPEKAASRFGYRTEDQFETEDHSSSQELAHLVEKLCECSLADDEAGIAFYSVLLQRLLAQAPTRH